MIRGSWEKYREYIRRYKLRWTKKQPPLQVYGPYKNSDPHFTTPPPPPGGSAGLALASLIPITRCGFGFHNLGPRKRSDCPPPSPGDAAEALATAALSARCKFQTRGGEIPWYCNHLNLMTKSGFKIQGFINGTSASFTAVEE